MYTLLPFLPTQKETTNLLLFWKQKASVIITHRMRPKQDEILLMGHVPPCLPPRLPLLTGPLQGDALLGPAALACTPHPIALIARSLPHRSPLPPRRPASDVPPPRPPPSHCRDRRALTTRASAFAYSRRPASRACVPFFWEDIHEIIQSSAKTREQAQK